MEPHIKALASECRQTSFMINLLELLSTYTIRNIYFTKFHSLVRLGTLFWGEWGEIYKKNFKLQKRVIRAMIGVNT
jgi:hypothetical protein